MVRGITTGVALMLLAGLAEAQVYKCNGADGRTVYQQQPCAEDTEGEAVREISITQGMPAEQRQQLEAMQAARAQQESVDRQQRITESAEELRTIRQENADPEKCQQAHNGLELLEARGGDMRGVDAFHYRSLIRLYCNP